MLIGHFAVAFIGKRIEPKLSLGTMALAAMLPVFLWPIFTIAGVEYQSTVTENNRFDAPLSHSLLMVVIWAVMFTGIYFLRQRYHNHQANLQPYGIVFLVVLSHWFLDSISHKPALTPGAQTYFGLELWQSLPATLIFEGGFWLLAISLYVRATYARNRAGRYGFWLVVAFLTFVWITNIRKGPPLPNAVIGSLIFFSLLVSWAYWLNRTRPTSE